MKRFLITIFASFFLSQASGMLVRLPLTGNYSGHAGMYVGRTRLHNMLSRRLMLPHRTTRYYNHPRLNHVLLKSESSYYPLTRQYRPAKYTSYSYPMFTRHRSWRTRFPRPNYHPRSRNRLRHSRNKSFGYSMLNSLMEGSRQICHWKHQQPQIYALLEAALESMHNHTVVQVHYVTVFLKKRCDWTTCRPKKYEVDVEFTAAPSNGCNWKTSCGCQVKSYAATTTCKANGTLLHQGKEISNVTLACDNGFVLKNTSRSSFAEEKMDKQMNNVSYITSHGGSINDETETISSDKAKIQLEKNSAVALVMEDKENHQGH